MRKVILFNMVTVDGFFEGKNKWEIGWHTVDEEFNEFAIQQLDQAGGLIFGRVTYLGMAAYWPTPTGVEDDPIVAGKMNSLPKYVFSHQLEKVEWENSQLVRGDAVEELRKLKEQQGKDLYIFGSAELTDTFIRNHLVDEFRLMVNPVVLGGGNPLFKPNGTMLKLKLLGSRTFRNGNVLLYYQPGEK